MTSSIIRTFLGFQVPRWKRAYFAELQRAAGQHTNIVELAMLHLTLCVVGETPERDASWVPRIGAAFAAGLPPAPIIRFGCVKRTAMGATLVTRGRRTEILGFYDELISLLATAAIPPLHRIGGLNPHITLGYDRNGIAIANTPWHWVPDELRLIESHTIDGGWRRAHRILHRWTLLPPAQSAFAFMADEAPSPPMPALLRAA